MQENENEEKTLCSGNEKHAATQRDKHFSLPPWLNIGLYDCGLLPTALGQENKVLYPSNGSNR